jgi:hypothetical protein
MAEFFPRKTVAWRLEEPPALKRVSLSLPEMALITGIVLRLWRWYTFSYGSPDSTAWVGGTFLAGLAFLLVMVTLHLGNYTLRNWIWRAPAFAVLEAGTEIVVSLALTAMGKERIGADAAELSDWLPTAERILIVRLGGIAIFALVLAIVVSIVRRLLLASEDRTHTVQAIHRASIEQEQHQESEKGSNK